MYDPVEEKHILYWIILKKNNKNWNYITLSFLLTVGAVSNTIRVNMLYSGDSRNCITWQEALNC